MSDLLQVSAAVYIRPGITSEDWLRIVELVSLDSLGCCLQCSSAAITRNVPMCNSKVKCYMRHSSVSFKNFSLDDLGCVITVRSGAIIRNASV